MSAQAFHTRCFTQSCVPPAMVLYDWMWLVPRVSAIGVGGFWVFARARRGHRSRVASVLVFCLSGLSAPTFCGRAPASRSHHTTERLRGDADIHI